MLRLAQGFLCRKPRKNSKNMSLYVFKTDRVFPGRENVKQNMQDMDPGVGVLRYISYREVQMRLNRQT
jgi:hypothetical protein